MQISAFGPKATVQYTFDLYVTSNFNALKKERIKDKENRVNAHGTSVNFDVRDESAQQKVRN
jgi:hypothetical protein